MNLRMTLAMIALVGLVATGFVNAEEKEGKKKKKDPLADVKCPISGKAIDKDQIVAYKDAKVYMCCGNCVKSFAKDSKKHATKANHQLVMTKQFKQEKCALNGKGKINKEAKTKVAGVSVNFCCKNCLGKVTKMKEKEQIEALFSKNFDKAFKVVKKEKKGAKAEAKDEKTAA